jgi:molecular chaperone GrpE
VGLIFKFLPVLDNLDIAEKKLPEKLKKDVNVKGLLQIKEQIKTLFKGQGVEEINSLGREFDPSLQELVGEVDLAVAKKIIGKKAKVGIVVEEIQKGYKIHGRLLRPAKVKIVKYIKIKTKK